MSATAIDPTQITEHMPVVCSNGGQCAAVDHLDAGGTIEPTKDEQGHHHRIPMSWVRRVDEHDRVDIDRPGDQAMRKWPTTPPAS